MEPIKKEFDVVIIGASIAGCTAAMLFGKQGLRVALIEQHKEPKYYKKICTHYIQSSAIPTIDRLGLLEKLEKAGANFGSVDFWSPWGWFQNNHDKNFEEKIRGVNIRRQTLDPILKQMAKSSPGVESFFGYRCNQLLKTKNKIV